MEYKIISGRVEEVRRSYLPVRSPGEPKGRRAPRRAGSSSERKIIANEQEAKKKAARTLNCNFGAGDILLTAKYDREHLPADYATGEKTVKRIIDKARRRFKKETGRTPKLFWVTANWSPKRKAPARLHHHLVCEADFAQLLFELWEAGTVSLEKLDNRGDHSDLAAYLLENVQGKPGGERYHVSRNLDKPIYTEPVPVEDVEDVRPEKGAVIQEHNHSLDEEGHVVSTYMRCVLPVRPRVRGGVVVMPRAEKRGGRKGGSGRG